MFLWNGRECDLVSILAALLVQIGSNDLAALQSHAVMNSNAIGKTLREWSSTGLTQTAHENVSWSALGSNTLCKGW